MKTFINVLAEVSKKSTLAAKETFAELSAMDKAIIVGANIIGTVGPVLMLNKKTRRAGLVLSVISFAGTPAVMRWSEKTNAKLFAREVTETVDLAGAFAPAHEMLDRVLQERGESLETLHLVLDEALDRDAELDDAIEAEFARFEQITGEKLTAE